jgi:hypothetical protein
MGSGANGEGGRLIWPVLSVKVVAPFNAHFTEEERATLLELMGRI